MMLSRALSSTIIGHDRDTVRIADPDHHQGIHIGQENDFSKREIETNGNLQAGRKRRESEMDSTNDSGDGNNVRRRISRACDQCNQLRTKCDGKHPCAHCNEIGSQCEYARAYKKRGRAPKKDQDQMSDEQNSANNPSTGQSTAESHQAQALTGKYSETPYYTGQHAQEQVLPSSTSPGNASFDIAPHNSYYNYSNTTPTLGMNGAGGLSNSMVPNIPQQHYPGPTSTTFATSAMDVVQQGFGFPMGDDYSVAFMGKAPMVDSPDWMALATPMFMPDVSTSAVQSRPPDTLRFPVLRPLLPYIEPIMPQNIACDLLEQYFTSSTSLYLRPSNPYIIAYVLRKKSFLTTTDPRSCTPALLSSMLWIAAQVSDAAFLSSQLDARAKVCQKLLELTINMLRPLVHNSSGMVVGTVGYPSTAGADAGLPGLVPATDHTDDTNLERIQIDNLITYIHLATVVSASERKAASLRWWNAAWSLARELRLGREVPDYPNQDDQSSSSPNTSRFAQGLDPRKSSLTDAKHTSHQQTMTAEHREERRRVWWLLYMQDRHLALCYNRPLFFLNKECEHLPLPVDEEVWQSDGFEQAVLAQTHPGLNVDCTSHSVYGFFLPLMVILGEILDLNHARNRPRFGPKANQPRNWDEFIDDITQQLDMFEHSLRRFEATNGTMGNGTHLNGNPNSSTSSAAMADALSVQTQTVMAYGTHIMHVLHILLTGKWDPIALLDDNDLWISSQSFITATGHAVSAAKAVADIIEYDPDLSFMPYFFGIYLLQGSFLLLLFADKLQGDVSPDVVKACETIVRAHEACVATLDTQYQVSKLHYCVVLILTLAQRNFRKVMRSALQQVRGRLREDPTEQQNWRREVLKLYRWTGDGTGLAL